MISLLAIPVLVFPVLLVTAALRDVTSFTIPNWISAALLLAFPVAAMAGGLGWGEAAQHAAVGGAALLLGMGLFAMNWVGGGDAKLLSASALWLGLAGAPQYLLWTAVAGGGLTLALVAARTAHAVMPLPGAPSWAQTLLRPKGDVPYGVALAAGALLAFPHSTLFQRAF
jgi:prepilin peptidase CpaA